MAGIYREILSIEPADEGRLPVWMGGVDAPDVEVVIAGDRLFSEGVFVVGEDPLGGEVDRRAVFGGGEDALDFGGAGFGDGDLPESGQGLAFPAAGPGAGGMSQA